MKRFSFSIFTDLHCIYIVQISVPTDFKVIMSGINRNITTEAGRFIYEFCQDKKIPSYAMVIVVGFLEMTVIELPCIDMQCYLWAEKKYIQQSIKAFKKIIPMLHIPKYYFRFGNILTQCLSFQIIYIINFLSQDNVFYLLLLLFY